MAIDSSVEQQATILYEKEVQTYLAANLHLLGNPKLELIQTEYPIKFGKDSGRIDLLAKDTNGDLVVVEVKRGLAGRSAIGQVQSYMGSLMTEFPSNNIRGILVAMGLDEAARSALLVTQDVTYFEFKTRFDFIHVEVVKPEVRQAQIDKRAEVRKDYWEGLGGKVSKNVVTCRHCGKFAKVVIFGASNICGVCGKSAH